MPKEDQIAHCNSQAKEGDYYRCLECQNNYFETNQICQEDSEKALCMEGEHFKEGQEETCRTCAVSRGFYAISTITLSGYTRQVCERGIQNKPGSFLLIVGLILVGALIIVGLIYYCKMKDTSAKDKSGNYVGIDN